MASALTAVEPSDREEISRRCEIIDRTIIERFGNQRATAAGAPSCTLVGSTAHQRRGLAIAAQEYEWTPL